MRIVGWAGVGAREEGGGDRGSWCGWVGQGGWVRRGGRVCEVGGGV